MSEKRPREYGVLFSVKEDTQTDGYIFGRDGTLMPTLGGVPIPLAEASVEVSYDRPKGRKVLLRAPADAANPSIDPNANLLRYRDVFAIDTNTELINGDSVSASCVVRCIRQKTDSGMLYVGEPIGAHYAFYNVRGNPERVAWKFLCEGIIARSDFSPEDEIGIVVDSHLADLSEINRRSRPLIDEWLLPQGLLLIYASDAACDSIPNRLIRDCDRMATKILELIRSGTGSPPEEALPGEPFSHIKSWSWSPAPESSRG